MQNHPAEQQPFDPRPEAARWQFRLEELGISPREAMASRWITRLRRAALCMPPPFSSQAYAKGYEFHFADGSKLRLSQTEIKAV